MNCRHREHLNATFLVAALVCLLCCLAVAQEEAAVRTSHAAGTDFSKFHTYHWVEIKGQHPDPSVDAEIKQSIDSQLTAKGLTKTDDASDLGVDYQTAMSKAKTWQTFEDWSDPSLLGQRVGERKEVTIEVGTLAVDIYDTAAKQLVWTGRAHKTLDPTSKPEDRKRNLDKATKELFKDFPPK